MKAESIIKSAFRKIGIVSPDATKMDQALENLNDLLSSWSADSLLVPYRATETFALSIGVYDYSIGNGGDFNTARPTKIIQAYITKNNLDYPVAIISLEDYRLIPDKTTSGTPSKMAYDPQYPLGVIYVYPAPDSTLNLTIVSEKEFPTFPDLYTDVDIPDFYKKALIYNLAVELASEFDISIQPQVAVIATEAVKTLHNYVASVRFPGEVPFDPALMRRKTYNIQTDQS